MPHWEFDSNVRYCVHSGCTFPFTSVGGRGRGDVFCRFVFQVKHTHTDLIILFINYLLECCKTFDGKPINLS